MIILATKNSTNSTIVFDLPGMTEKQAIKHARDSIRKTIWDRLKKRPWGWKFKIK